MNEEQPSPATTRRRRMPTQELAPLPALPELPAEVTPPPPPPDPAVNQEPVVLAEKTLPQPERFPNTDLSRFDAVQVINPQSRHYGLMFSVGDIKLGKVHGYYIAEGRNKQYITVQLQDCHRIGESKIRTTTPCSHKWTADNR